MKKLIILLTIVLALFTKQFPVNAQPPNIDARSYILIDSKTGLVILEKNAHEKLNPASTTKIMTGILAIENGDPEQLCTVSQYAIDNIGPGGMHIGLLAGEQIELKHLLNALLIRSANETSYVIAQSVAPSLQDFYEMMNKKALELGAKSTNFVNPCGIDNGSIGDKHLTTASDLAKIARHAMSLPQFREVVKRKGYTVPPTNKHSEEVYLASTNRLLTYGKYNTSDYYTSVTGIKTGYTDKAGNCLVSSAINKDGLELIAVVLGVRGEMAYERVFDYSKTLLEYGFKNYNHQKIVDAGTYASTIPVIHGKESSEIDLVIKNNVEIIQPLDGSWEPEVKSLINKDIIAPVDKGDVLGHLEFMHNGVVLEKVDLVAKNAVQLYIPEPSTAQILSTSIDNPIFKRVLIGTIFFFLTFIALRFTLKRISRSVNARKYSR